MSDESSVHSSRAEAIALVDAHLAPRTFLPEDTINRLEVYLLLQEYADCDVPDALLPSVQSPEDVADILAVYLSRARSD